MIVEQDRVVRFHVDSSGGRWRGRSAIPLRGIAVAPVSAPVDTADGRGTVLSHTSTPSPGTLESTRDGAPHAILYGRRKIMPGLERALAGRAAGDRFAADPRPEEACGLRREGWTRRVSKKRLLGRKRFAAGETAWLGMPGGERPVTVLEVGSSLVGVDPNHPLAGATLHAGVEVAEVRAAGRGEIAHGHVHPPGGHGP